LRWWHCWRLQLLALVLSWIDLHGQVVRILLSRAGAAA
jgi:hypothetical protein